MSEVRQRKPAASARDSDDDGDAKAFIRARRKQRQASAKATKVPGLLLFSLAVVVGTIASMWYMSPVDPIAYKPGKLRPIPEDAAPSLSALMPAKGAESLRGAVAFAFPAALSDEELAEEQARAKEAAADPDAEPYTPRTNTRVFAGTQQGTVMMYDWATGEASEVVRFGKNSSALPPQFECGDGQYSNYFETVCGRPMGMDFDMDGLRLIVADAYKGLYQVNVEEGTYEALTLEDDKGEPFTFINQLAVSRATGRVYFTESSTAFQRRLSHIDLLGGRSSGRLMVYDPADGTTTVLAKRLAFPSGLVVVETRGGDRDEFVLVAETARNRVTKFILPEDPAEGKVRKDKFIADLPGAPHNMVWDEQRSRVWVTVTLRTDISDALTQWPSVRKVLGKSPDFVVDAVKPKDTAVLVLKPRSKLSSRVLSAALVDPEHAAETVTAVTGQAGLLFAGAPDQPLLVANLPKQ